MSQDRRQFIKTVGAGALGLSTADWWGQPLSAQTSARRTGPYRDWGASAIAQAKSLGCTYADIRFGRKRSQALNVRNGQLTQQGGFSYGGGMTFVGGNIAMPGMPASATLPGSGVTTVSKVGSLLSRRDVP